MRVTSTPLLSYGYSAASGGGAICASRSMLFQYRALEVSSSRSRWLFARVEPVFDFLPVDYVPPGGNVIRAAVLILQVVGVLPHVQAHHVALALHYGAVLVGGGRNLEFPAGSQQPRPAGAEARGRGLVELLLEALEAAESADDRLGHVAHRRPSTARPHDLPEHRVVDVAAAVVAHRGANVLGNDGAVAGQQLLDGLVRQGGGRFQRFVQVGDIRVMVLAVVDLHRHFVDVRLQRIGRIGQWRKCERHSDLLYPLVGARHASPECNQAGSPAFSKASASRNMVVSSKCLVKICIPTGNPPAVFPHGTLMHGIPAKSPVMV